MQYQSLTGPIFTASTPPPEDKGWNRAPQPEPVRRTWSAALTVVACVLPLTTAQPLETYGWQRQQPDPVRRTGIIAALQQDAQSRNTITGLFDVRTDAGGSSISAGSVPILQYQALAAPFFIIPPDAPATIRIGLVTPLSKQAHPSLMPSWFADKFTAPTAPTVTANSWQGYQPARIPPTRGTPAHLQRAYVSDTLTVPNVIAAPDSIWQSVSAYQPIRQRALAPYTWGQQHFAFLQLVPVMSWTGMYLDPPVLRTSPRAIVTGVHVWPIGISGTPPPTELTWQGAQPHKLDPKAWSVAAEEAKTVAPHFVSDVTTGPTALSWKSSYPDTVWPMRALFVGHQPAWTSDKFTAPTVVAAPDVYAPSFPVLVLGKPPLRQQAWSVAPVFVADVTQQAPLRSWAPTYPDWIARELYDAANQDASTEPIFIPGITVIPPALSWWVRPIDQALWTRIHASAHLPYAGVVFITDFLPSNEAHEIFGTGSFVRRLYGSGVYIISIPGKGSL